MNRSIHARLRAAEKRVGAAASERRTHSLEQLVLASYGKPIGPPTVVLKPGEENLEELLAAASAPEP